MDEGFKCPVEVGGGYYGARAPGGADEGKTAEDGDAGVLPYRLRVGCSPLSVVVSFDEMGLVSSCCLAVIFCD